MKTYIFLILSLFQFSIGYSQKGRNLKLVYCEESNPAFRNYGPDIIGYYQLLDTAKNNKQIAKINTLLRLWHVYSYIDSRLDNQVNGVRCIKYAPYLSADYKDINYRTFDSSDWKDKLTKLRSNKLIVDTLLPTKKYIYHSDTNSVLWRYSRTCYIFDTFNDSLFLISIWQPDYYGPGYTKSIIYNLNTGQEVGIYDFIEQSKLKEFIFYVFKKAYKINKNNVTELSESGGMCECVAMIVYDITMFPQMKLNMETKELDFHFGTYKQNCTGRFLSGGNDLVMQMSEIEKYLQPNCFLFKIQNLIK